ncbi:hypothetical protein ASE39_14690 [Acidovorax sp. Root267]|nr:hypothetical protein ASE39_14690 [Acidovorax sp. Root267]
MPDQTINLHWTTVPSCVVLAAVPWLKECHVVSGQHFYRPHIAFIFWFSNDQAKVNSEILDLERNDLHPLEGYVPETCQSLIGQAATGTVVQAGTWAKTIDPCFKEMSGFVEHIQCYKLTSRMVFTS